VGGGGVGGGPPPPPAPGGVWVLFGGGGGGGAPGELWGGGLYLTCLRRLSLPLQLLSSTLTLVDWTTPHILLRHLWPLRFAVGPW
jgi:hypothetical protein